MLQNELGKEGEILAAEYLKTQGYTIVCRNYRYRKAEIDIIAKKGDILAIVEVKYRSARHLGNIADSITQKKIKLLTLAADHFVSSSQEQLEVRFDIITVLNTGSTTKIEHLPDAFYHF